MLRVLVIDDEECIRNPLSIHLSHLGYSVETASNPLACRCVQTGQCQAGAPFADVILVDQWMPGMTGLEFLANRSQRGCKGLAQHLAIMSANLTDEETRRARELGCKVFLKPFSLLEVEQWLESIVCSLTPD